jgi:hypothetical protein
MTNNLVFGPKVERISRIIHKGMPHLAFAIWDLTPFIPHMHNWRKNMIFIECEKVGVEPLMELLAPEFPDANIYAGTRKPSLKINRVVADETIVIVSRTPRDKTPDAEIQGVSIEKCLVDMLHYSRKGIVPLYIGDVVDLWEQTLGEHEKRGLPKVVFSELYRYAMRRYLAWFVSIFVYKMSKTTKVIADPRHLAAGQANLELINMVETHG